jgi:hypothetical protein
MQGWQIWQKARARHAQKAGEVLAKDMSNASLVVDVCFSHPGQISFKSFLALPALDCVLHARNVRGELDTFAVAEPHVVIRLAFPQNNTFIFECGVKVYECFTEHIWEEQQGRALVESVAISVDETTSAASEVILLDDSHTETSFGEASSTGNAASSSTCGFT